jgi:hypothetical protein
MVTVARGLTKDRLTQACMRMRRLGKGQRVRFILSHEAFLDVAGGAKQYRPKRESVADAKQAKTC